MMRPFVTLNSTSCSIGRPPVPRLGWVNHLAASFRNRTSRFLAGHYRGGGKDSVGIVSRGRVNVAHENVAHQLMVARAVESMAGLKRDHRREFHPLDRQR